MIPQEIKKPIKRPFDFVIFIVVIILLTIGTIMIFSAGAPHAYRYMNGDTYYFLKKQLLYVPLGIIAMLVMMKIDYRRLGKLSPIFILVSLAMLALVLVPGIGQVLNGARRWFNIAGQTFQPSEIAKLSIIIFLAYSLSKNKEKIKNFSSGILPYLALIGVFALLLLLEPHLSCTIIVGAVTFILLFSAGAKIKHFAFLSVPVLLGLTVIIVKSPYRLKRLVSFIDPWSDPKGDGWQVVQSLYAFGSGGLFGRGLGRSMQKFLYIPEPCNDFILPILAEELGFIGVLTVLVLFMVFFWRGIKVAIYAQDMFGSLLAIGITSLIMIQVVVNVAVVTSSMPVTGMPLPFFSYGGTSLIFLMSAVGILLNISKTANYDRL